MKRTIAILLAAVMVLAMLACAGKKKDEDKSPMTAEQAIQSATDLLKKAESVHLDYTNNQAYIYPKSGSNYTSYISVSSDIHQNPPVNKTTVAMSSNGQNSTAILYMEKENDTQFSYVSYDDGKTWSVPQQEDALFIFDMPDAFQEWLGSVSNVQRIGNATINGKETTMFKGEITGDAFVKMAKSFMPAIYDNNAEYQVVMERMKEAKPIEITMWFADTDCSLVRFRLDMLDCINAIGENYGVQYTAYDTVYNLQYNCVPAITIPEAARESRNAAAIVGTWEMDFEASLAELSEEDRSYMEALGITAASYKAEYTFNADGTGKEHIEALGMNQDIDFTYTDNNGELTQTATVDGETFSVDFSYTINGNTLTLFSGEETMIFNRK